MYHKLNPNKIFNKLSKSNKPSKYKLPTELKRKLFPKLSQNFNDRVSRFFVIFIKILFKINYCKFTQVYNLKIKTLIILEKFI